MQDELSDHKPFDMTLRLWSDSVPLEPIVALMGLKAEHLHRIGEPRQVRGRALRGTVDRHYASLARTRGTEEDVTKWIQSTLNIIGLHQQLVKDLKGERIEGLLWITRLRGDDGSPMPTIEPALVDSACEEGLRIFLENYTDFGEEGAPKREWLPA